MMLQGPQINKIVPLSYCPIIPLSYCPIIPLSLALTCYSKNSRINKVYWLIDWSSIYYLQSKIGCELCIFSNVDRLLLLFTGYAKSYHGELDMVVFPPGLKKDLHEEPNAGVMPNNNWRYLCIMSLVQYHSELMPLRNGGRVCHC